MSLLDDILEGIDKWSKGELHPKKELSATPSSSSPTTPSFSLSARRKSPIAKQKIATTTTAISSTTSNVGEKRYSFASLQERFKKQKTDVEIRTKMVSSEMEQQECIELGDEPVIKNKMECLAAIKEIMNTSEKIIAVDCEGVNLGREGRLCLVQVATSHKVYLFDIIEGGAVLFDSGLRQILEDPNMRKVIHDCRLDSDALFHEYQVSLKNVFDTQVAFALVIRGQGAATPFPVGLNTLLKRYGKGATNEVKDEMKAEMQADPEFWAKRPFSETALKYARQDVLYLCTVQRQLNALFSNQAKQNLELYCNVYITQYRDAAQVVRMSRSTDSEERFVPKYGIKEWDMDISLNLERNAQRQKSKKQ